ncbi:hypothetical protein Efla_007345 [Eimeria flavescens]
MAREEFVYVASVAQETDRFDDVVKAMKEVVAEGKGLNRDEATLFSLGYKQKITSCRNTWRNISLLESKGLETGNPVPERLIQYRQEIEKETEDICNEVIQLVEHDILPNVKGAESEAFFVKMKADYYRYLAEFAQENSFDSVVQKALEAYEQASKIADEGLPEGHPVRLGIALNFSVFYFEALNDQTKACELAKAAIGTPESALSALPEDQARDSESMLKLLQENLTLWTGGAGEEEEADEEDTDH